MSVAVIAPCSQRIARSGGLAAGCGDPAGAKQGNNTQRGDYRNGSHEKMAEDKPSYCVYILSCADGFLYTGLTKDLKRRLSEHMAGAAGWTRTRLPVELVFSLEGLNSFRAALRVESYIKTLTRERKEALIAGNPGMLSLVKKRARNMPLD